MPDQTETAASQACATPLADLRAATLLHYEELSAAAHCWMNTIPRAINAYFDAEERAASPSAGRTDKTDPYFVLSFCEAAIRDAISLEDGLDASAGEAVLAMIAASNAARRAAEGPREEQTGGFFCDRHEQFAIRDVATGEMRCPDCPVPAAALPGAQAAPTLDLGEGETWLTVEQERNRALVHSLQVLKSFTGTGEGKRHHAGRVREMFAALTSEVARLRAARPDEEGARDRQDAARWRWFRQWLSVEDDVPSGGQYLLIHDLECGQLVNQPGHENTVEAFVDDAILRDATTPSLSAREREGA